MNSAPRNVPVGLSTYVGYGLAFVSLVAAGLTAVTASEAQLHGPGKWAAILGVISAVATNAGRQLQAAGVRVVIPQAVQQTIAELPTLEEELAQQPPAQV